MYMFLNLIFVWFSFFLPYKFTHTIKKKESSLDNMSWEYEPKRLVSY